MAGLDHSDAYVRAFLVDMADGFERTHRRFPHAPLIHLVDAMTAAALEQCERLRIVRDALRGSASPHDLALLLSAAQPWDTVLDTPGRLAHVMQLYTDDAELARSVASFVAAGLERGEAAVIIATPAHRAAITERLAVLAAPSPPAAAERLVMLDAEQCLEAFMIHGAPNADAFRAWTAPLFDRLHATGHSRLRLYGEMVNVLWPKNHAATVALEELWNETLRGRNASLLCGYRVDTADGERPRELLNDIARCHSRVLHR